MISDPYWGTFPDELLCPRGLLIEWLGHLGFDPVELDSQQTGITDDPNLRAMILGNQAGHESFTIEAQRQ